MTGHDDPAADDASYDDPGTLAAVVAAASRPLLVGLDIDGVLAPIVAHADDSQLVDGVVEVIERLSQSDDVTVAAVSGRSLADIARFGFPGGIRIVGGHGVETDDAPLQPLAPDESLRFAELLRLAGQAADRAGPGAWVEQKATSIAVHVREADPDRADPALADLATAAGRVDGAATKAGSRVLELFARPASKGTAVQELRARTGAATTVFVGDDVTDEEAFAVLGPDDVAIKVGDADTIAPHRLADPNAVLVLLQTLADTLH